MLLLLWCGRLAQGSTAASPAPASARAVIEDLSSVPCAHTLGQGDIYLGNAGGGTRIRSNVNDLSFMPADTEVMRVKNGGDVTVT